MHEPLPRQHRCSRPAPRVADPRRWLSGSARLFILGSDVTASLKINRSFEQFRAAGASSHLPCSEAPTRMLPRRVGTPAGSSACLRSPAGLFWVHHERQLGAQDLAADVDWTDLGNRPDGEEWDE